ncbi:MAG: hypothetical protein HYS22_03315 [Deltaproteobacteria bacterium]|nr:hypothetical protein [Deltaproteobacteria bacterium]
MVNCLSPTGWEVSYCRTTQSDLPQYVAASATAAEIVRSRYFSMGDWQTHYGVHVYRPRWRFEIRADLLNPGSGSLPTPSAESASVVGMNFLPQARVRAAAHNTLRAVGALTHLYFGAHSASRLAMGDSRIEGTRLTDTLFMSQAFVGLLAVVHPERLERGVAAHVSAFIGIGGLMVSGEDFAQAITYRETDSESFRQYTNQIALMAASYAFGVGGRPLPYQDRLTGRMRRGAYQQLKDDGATRSLIDRQALREAEWRLSGSVRLESRFLTRYHRPAILTSRTPRGQAYVDVVDSTYVGFDTVYDWRTGTGHLTRIGSFEVHQPVRQNNSGAHETIDLPDVTTRIENRLQGRNYAPRLRQEVANLPNSPIEAGFYAHAANAPALVGTGDGYHRQVWGTRNPRLRQAAFVRAWQFEPDHLTGKAVRLTRPMVAVRPDHRGNVNSMASLDYWFGDIWTPSFWRGTARNLVDSFRYRARLRKKVAAAGLHHGYADHPQVTTPRFLGGRREALLREQETQTALFREQGLQPGNPNVRWLSGVPPALRSQPQISPTRHLLEMRQVRIREAAEATGIPHLSTKQYLRFVREAETYGVRQRDYHSLVREQGGDMRAVRQNLAGFKADAESHRIPLRDYMAVRQGAAQLGTTIPDFLPEYRRINRRLFSAHGEGEILSVEQYVTVVRGARQAGLSTGDYLVREGRLTPAQLERPSSVGGEGGGDSGAG